MSSTALKPQRGVTKSEVKIHMSSFRQILYHIIFRTKNSANTLTLSGSEDLYRYTGGIINNKKPPRGGFLYLLEKNGTVYID